MTVKLLTEQHLEFLSLKLSCTGSSESTLAKMPHCWKSHVAAQIVSFLLKITMISLTTSTAFIQAIYLAFNIACNVGPWYLPTRHTTLKQRHINVDATSSTSIRRCFDVMFLFGVHLLFSSYRVPGMS